SAKETWKALKHPVALALFLFLLSMAISAVFSTNPYRAFWGTIERGEGVFGVAHYIALFFFVAVFLRHKERLIFLKLFLVSGYALIFHGAAQKLAGLDRVTSYIGNSAFFAGHLLFLIAVAWIVMQESKKKGIWWYLALVFIPLAVLEIVMTGTRGALLGAGAGALVFLFTVAVRRFGKKALWALVGICIVGSIGVWMGSGRVRTLLKERSDSIQTRLTMWEAGWEAFKVKPLIGWGPEHFILASSRHYNPEAARFGETWFDRAHNKILDILISQGVLGGLIFIGLLGSVLFTVWRDTTYKKPLTLAFGSAYLIQTMFAPDQIVSWIGLMVFLGYIVGAQKKEEHSKNEKVLSSTRLAGKIGAAGVGVLMGAALYYGNVLPYTQLKALFKAKGAEDPIPFLERAFVKDTFARAEAEANLLDFYMENRPDLITNKETGDRIRDEARALVKKEPQDIRYGIQYVRVMTEQGKKDKVLYEEAEKELKNLLHIAPNRQEIYYLLALVKGLRGELEEAIETARRAVEIDQKVPRAHYVLGVALASSGKADLQKQAEEELMKAEDLNPSLDALQNSDVDTLISMYESGKRWDRIAGMALRNAEGAISWTIFPKRVFIIALFHFAEKKNEEAFMKIARYVESKFPEQKEAAEEAVRLAEKGEWDIIQSMFEIE
ncbi:MAG: O-antigen ligase family protein, partial [Candidatus Wolfebacteria bacterium]|nr:O-antigen ligase family protein [Candidatus Wolfebacteria bacterium]